MVVAHKIDVQAEHITRHPRGVRIAQVHGRFHHYEANCIRTKELFIITVLQNSNKAFASAQHRSNLSPYDRSVHSRVDAKHTYQSCHWCHDSFLSTIVETTLCFTVDMSLANNTLLIASIVTGAPRDFRLTPLKCALFVTSKAANPVSRKQACLDCANVPPAIVELDMTHR